MGKKRVRDADPEEDSPANDGTDKMDEESSDDDFDMVNVDFEWFNFDRDIDFQGVKNLLRQLLDVDAALFDLSELADLVVEQHTIGSTVKVDGKENDAYAMVTALNLREHRGKKAVAALGGYLAEKAGTNPALKPVPALLAGDDAHVALVLSERLINMPPEVAPPMYAMLAEEIDAAVEDGEPYRFTHYLVLSKTYQEVESALDAETDRKRKKARDGGGSSPLFYFHPEDEVLQRHAAAHGGFAYSREDEAVADSKRAFQEMGVRAQGHMILIEAGKFAGAVKAVGEYLAAPGR